MDQRPTSSMSATTNPFRALMSLHGEHGQSPTTSSDEHSAEWTEAVEAFKRADNAKAALPHLKERLKDAQSALDRDEATLRALTQSNISAYDSMHATPPAQSTSKRSLLGRLGGRGRAQAPAADQADPQLERRNTERAFNASYLAEVRARENVEAAKAIVEKLKAERTALKDASAEVAEKFERVRELAERLFPPTVVARLPRLTEARRALLAEDENVEVAHHVATDIDRACRAAQQSHKHLRAVLDLSDKGRSSNTKAIGAFGAISQIEVLNIFKKAVELSTISQTCLDECMNMLQRHNELLPQDQALYAQKLRENGVSQVQRMYNIMYGGDAGLRGVTRDKQLDSFDSGQKDAFDYLTRLAVWLQNQVPLLQRAQEDAAERRRAARRQLVDMWEDELHIQRERTRISWAGSNSSHGHVAYPPAPPSDISAHSTVSLDSTGRPRRPTGPRRPLPVPPAPPVMMNRAM